MCCSGADNPNLKQKTELQEQDIELAQHTPHHNDGKAEVHGDDDEVRRMKIFFMHKSWSSLATQL